MSARFDLVIRGGLLLDGSGAPGVHGDVAVRAGRIVAIGEVSGSGREEIDASGRLVTPGFVDIHTHYDGQITWEQRLTPSSHHGVTTVVMGNCGVGFAPCKPHDHELLVEFMEGVEDIPGIVMTRGLPWNWETFPEFLDSLSDRTSDVDFATQIAHSAIRVYVMGERAADRQAPTRTELERMTELVAEALCAGALGVSTSRSIDHRAKDGRLVPSVKAEEDELLALANGLKRAGRGVFQILPNPHADPNREFALIRRIAEQSGRPVSFSLIEWPHMPGGWQIYLDRLAEAQAEGLPIRAQIYPRPLSVLLGLDLSLNPFSLHPSYLAIQDEPLERRLEIMQDEAFRSKLISEQPESGDEFFQESVKRLGEMFPITDRPTYDPKPSETVAAIAARRGRSILEFAYDYMLARGKDAAFYWPFANFGEGNLEHVRRMMLATGTVFGLGDGGAHYGMICDASYPTYTLTRWVRDASDADRVGLAWAIASMSSKPAAAVGLDDRGLLEPGYRADINVIDLDRLEMSAPRTVYDLPESGRRIIQPARGYDATLVHGEITYRHGQSTQALPGRLVRAGAAT